MLGVRLRGTAAVDAVPTLATLARDHDVAVAGDAVTALGMIGVDSPSARRALQAMSKHEDVQVAARARRALAQLVHPYEPDGPRK